MIEYTIIFVVVASAAWFTGRSLWRQTKNGTCSVCSCGEEKNAAPNLIQLTLIEKKDKK